MKKVSFEQHKTFVESVKNRYPKSYIFMQNNAVFVQGRDGVDIALFIDRENGDDILRFLGKPWDKQNISQVISFDIWIKKDNTWMLISKTAHLVEMDDLKDIYIAVRVSGNNAGHPDLYIYHNDVIEKNIKELYDYKVGQDLKVYYVKKRNGFYWHYIYKRHEEVLLLKDVRRFSFTQYTSGTHNDKSSKIGMDKEQYIKIWFHNSSSKNFYITERFAQENADYFYQEASPFSDDATINYCAVFNKNKKREIAFMREYACEYGYAIYGVTYDQLVTVCDIEPSYKKAYIEIGRLYEYLNQEDMLKDILVHIYDMLNKEVDYTKIPYINNYGSNYFTNVSMSNIVQGGGPYNIKQIKNDIYNQLIAEGALTPKWKTESDLYKIVKKRYPDSVFQFRAPFLKGQSIDIFIPSLNVGIEYQGIQHYEPVSIFGGEEGFLRTKERDKRKKEICYKNGLELIYWKYDEPVNSVQLGKKIALFQKSN